ncbi:hypothetical protein D3C71_1064540 [compost metagenome]
MPKPAPTTFDSDALVICAALLLMPTAETLFVKDATFAPSTSNIEPELAFIPASTTPGRSVSVAPRRLKVSVSGKSPGLTTRD